MPCFELFQSLRFASKHIKKNIPYLLDKYVPDLSKEKPPEFPSPPPPLTATKIIRSSSQLVYVRYCIKLTVGKSKKDRILLYEVVVFKV